MQRALGLIFALFPCQMKFFCILYLISIALLWSLVINKKCITLEVVRDLSTTILPSKVNCLMCHNFKNVFYFDNIFEKIAQDFYHTKNEHKFFTVSLLRLTHLMQQSAT